MYILPQLNTKKVKHLSEEVENCKEFGHGEADLVVGQTSGNDQVLLILAERKSCEYWMLHRPCDGSLSNSSGNI